MTVKKKVKKSVKVVENPPGRPPIVIDWDEFDKLCMIQCSEETIAFWFGCSIKTLQRACRAEKGLSFVQYAEQKRDKGRVGLRQKQFDLALKGDRTMLIWLGKQCLNQADKIDHRGEDGGPIKVTIRRV